MSEGLNHSSSKKIVVLGSRGMLGHTVCAYFKKNHWEVLSLDRSHFDLLKHPIEVLESLLVGANAVVNAIGILHSQIEKNAIEDVYAVNGTFPRDLARFCHSRKVPCFHISTDAVFSSKNGIVAESDTPDADDLYGMSKWAGESEDCMVLRASIIGEEAGEEPQRGRSLLEWMKNQKGGTVKGFVNHLWNGVTTLHLAETIESLLNQNLYEKGTFHIHSPEVINKFELLKLIEETYLLNTQVHPVEAERACNRILRSNHSLTGKLCRKPIHTQLQELRRFFSEKAAPLEGFANDRNDRY